MRKYLIRRVYGYYIEDTIEANSLDEAQEIFDNKTEEMLKQEYLGRLDGEDLRRYNYEGEA